MSAFNYAWETADGEKKLRFFFSPCEREPKTWKEELYEAARQVTNRTTKPIWVCASGGIDSEITARSFFDQGINFSVLSLEYEDGKNNHDIRHAVKWCKDRAIRHEIVPITVATFLTEGIDSYAEKYPALHPFRYLQLKLMELVEERGGYAVLGGGEQTYGADRTKGALSRSDMFVTFTTGNLTPLEWCLDHKTQHEPYFFFSTPELCLSYLRLPLVKFALDNPEHVLRHRASAYTLKRLVYESAFPDIVLRYKYDGFEKVRPLLEAARERLKKKFERDFVFYSMPITEFEGQLTAKLKA